jgi:hypothetical protein
MIDLLLKLGQALFGLRKDFQQADLAKRVRAAEFLSAIAEAIELTAAQLREGRFPAPNTATTPSPRRVSNSAGKINSISR